MSRRVALIVAGLFAATACRAQRTNYASGSMLYTNVSFFRVVTTAGQTVDVFNAAGAVSGAFVSNNFVEAWGGVAGNLTVTNGTSELKLGNLSAVKPAIAAAGSGLVEVFGQDGWFLYGLPNGALTLFWKLDPTKGLAPWISTLDKQNMPWNVLYDPYFLAGAPMQGAAAQIYQFWLGGSVSGAADLEPNGPEIWRALPTVPVFVQPYWEQHLRPRQDWFTNTLNYFDSSGVGAAFASNGVPVYFYLGPRYMLPNRGADGNFVVDTNRFPNGLRWLNDRIHERGYKSAVHTFYRNSLTNWSYVYDDFNDGPETQSVTTANNVYRDVKWFYDQGFDLVWVDTTSDPGPGLAGAQNQKNRLFASALLYPNGAHWAQNYSNQMAVTHLTSYVNWSTGAKTLTPDNVGAMANLLEGSWSISSTFTDIVREARSTYTNYAHLIGPGHFGGQVMPEQRFLATTNLARLGLAFGAVFPNMIQLDSSTNLGAIGICTNKDFLAVWTDPLYLPGWPAFDQGGGRLSAWVKPLKDGAFAVLFVNESNATANATLSFTNLSTPRGYMPLGSTYPPVTVTADATFSVRDVWNGTDLGWVTGQLSASVPASDVRLFRLTRAGYATNVWTVVFNRAMRESGSATLMASGPSPQFVESVHRCPTNGDSFISLPTFPSLTVGKTAVVVEATFEGDVGTLPGAYVTNVFYMQQFPSSGLVQTFGTATFSVLETNYTTFVATNYPAPGTPYNLNHWIKANPNIGAPYIWHLWTRYRELP